MQVKKMSQPDQGGVLLWTLSEEFQIREGRPSFCPSVDSSDSFNDISIFQRKCMQAHSKKAFDQHAKSKKHLQAGILFICTCFAWVMTLKWGCCKAEEGVGQRNGGNTHTHITDNRKKPIEFTLQNHEFWRKKPRMRIDYKKVMKANLLDFFESVRIWFDAEGTILEICWPSPDRTRWDGSVRWSPRCPEGSARSGKNVHREGSSERKTRSAGGNLGYLGAGLSYEGHFDWQCLTGHDFWRFHRDFPPLESLDWRFITLSFGLTGWLSRNQQAILTKEYKGCIARLARCGTSAVYIASILHCLTFLSCKIL